MKSDSNVFLYVYAPWCAYCKAFDSIYLELVAHYKQNNLDSNTNVNSNSNTNSNTDTLIVRMDGTVNEIDHNAVRILGYPTFLFFPSGAKSHPIEYENKRNLRDIIHFINSHSLTHTH